MSAYTPAVERPCRDGIQRVYLFANGYGASVVCHGLSYGGGSGKWELAVIRGVSVDDFNLEYDTPITDDVLGWLSNEAVEATLAEIEALPAVTA